MTKSNSLHAEASLHRKLVLFAVQLEGYLAHFPNCHKYTLTQSMRQAFIDVYNLTTEAQKRCPPRSDGGRGFPAWPRPAHLLVPAADELHGGKTQ